MQKFLILFQQKYLLISFCLYPKTNRINYGVEADTRKSQASEFAFAVIRFGNTCINRMKIIDKVSQQRLAK